ncbi:MAG: ATP-dependent DNA helicase [Erysipelotrichaceae bacterium]|jgi:DNA excision repair protein ERCC-2|nr:ATP-dependent DNA helicase [Erysipelotrichaceae bacterium]
MKTVLKLSVHQLVDFLLRKGSIDDRIFNQNTMNEGSRLHLIYQSQATQDVLIERYLQENFDLLDYQITLSGKADLIRDVSKKIPMIEEVKTSRGDTSEYAKENLDWHLGQAKCYAYMYAKEHQLLEIKVKLVYISQDTKAEVYTHIELFDFETLRQDIYQFLTDYLNYFLEIEAQKALRDQSLMKLKFPFPYYREGQAELMRVVDDALINKEDLFIEGATGSGKTISTLYPAIKNLYGTVERKIFFLTAKNSGIEAAEKALLILGAAGFKGKTVSIRSKEKTCPFKDRLCNPDDCELALNYYEKINQVVLKTFAKYDLITPDKIMEIAVETAVCPFELQLDLSTYADVILCDYNYFFDPIVFFQRHFLDDYSDDLILVDEAHNLKRRSEDMFSIEFPLSLIHHVVQDFPLIEDPVLVRSIKSLLTHFKKLTALYCDEYTVLETFDPKLMTRIETFNKNFIEYGKEKHQKRIKSLVDLFFVTNRFIKINELATTTSFIRYARVTISEATFCINCLSSKDHLKKLIEGAGATIFFSATLSPIEYYKEVLGGKSSDSYYAVTSPFSKDRFKVFFATGLDLRYHYRDQYLEAVADYIKIAISKRTGNYIAYFPSFEYLNKVLPYLIALKIKLVVQSQKMTLSEQSAFLAHFEPHPEITTLGLCITGGIFSESIDLIEERLAGVIIVGLSLPNVKDFQVQAQIKHFKDQGLNEYQFALWYPTVAKLLQTIGRVIRSEKDSGFALLIDQRFRDRSHYQYITKRFSNYAFVSNEEDFSQSLSGFLETLELASDE